MLSALKVCTGAEEHITTPVVDGHWPAVELS